jgi:hypothetical protein
VQGSRTRFPLLPSLQRCPRSRVATALPPSPAFGKPRSPQVRALARQRSNTISPMRPSRPRRPRTLLPLPPLRFESCPQRLGHIALVHHRPTSTSNGDVSALFAPRAIPHSNTFCARSASTPFRRRAPRRLSPRSTTGRHSSTACHLAARRGVTAAPESPAAVLPAQHTAPHRLAALDTSRLTFFCRQLRPQHMLRRVGDDIGPRRSLPQSLHEHSRPHSLPPHHRACTPTPPLVASFASAVSSPCQLPSLGGPCLPPATPTRQQVPPSAATARPHHHPSQHQRSLAQLRCCWPHRYHRRWRRRRWSHPRLRPVSLPSLPPAFRRLWPCASPSSTITSPLRQHSSALRLVGSLASPVAGSIASSAVSPSSKSTSVFANLADWCVRDNSAPFSCPHAALRSSQANR